MGTSGEAFGNSGEQIGKKGVRKQKIPPTPSGKGKEQANHEDMPSLHIDCRKFIFPKLSVSIIFLGFVLVVELISSQFLHLFLSRFVCFGCLFLKGAWETSHSQPPNPQSLLLQPRFWDEPIGGVCPTCGFWDMLEDELWGSAN